MDSALLTLTVLTTYSLLLPSPPVQAYHGGPQSPASDDFPPISISGACLVVLYTPQQTLKSKKWTTEFSADSWTTEVPVATFNQKPSKPRHGTWKYFKACNVIVVFTPGFSTLPEKALRMRKQMLRNDFTVIIDHVTACEESFNQERHVKMATKTIRHS